MRMRITFALIVTIILSYHCRHHIISILVIITIATILIGKISEKAISLLYHTLEGPAREAAGGHFQPLSTAIHIPKTYQATKLQESIVKKCLQIFVKNEDDDDQNQALSGVEQEPYCLSIIGVRWGVSLTTAGHTHHLYFHHYQCRNHQYYQDCRRRKTFLS